MRTESNVTLLKLLKQSKLSLLRWLSFHHLLFLFHCYIRVTFYFLLQYYDSTCLNKKKLPLINQIQFGITRKRVQIGQSQNFLKPQGLLGSSVSSLP